MSDTIVVYQSKYGATKRYAHWLAERLDCDILERSRCSVSALRQYRTVIYGGGIYASGIAGLWLIRKNLPALKDKRIAVFAVGASPWDETALAELKRRNLAGPLVGTPCFYLRGAFDEGRMNAGDKFLISLLKKAVARKDPAQYEPWEAALMESMGRAGDWTDPDTLAPLLAWARES